MEGNRRTWNYLKEMGARETADIYVIGKLDRRNNRVYIYRKRVFIKRNKKTAYIEYSGEWVPVPKGTFRTATHYDTRMASKYFQQDDMMETVAVKTTYIPKDIKKQILDNFLNERNLKQRYYEDPVGKDNPNAKELF